MKLYSAPMSPFAVRARMAVYAADLPVEVLAPPGGATQSTEYKAINPLGKVPALVLDDGTMIPESDTIVEYLADAFPQSGLRPAKPVDAARARLLARMAELYVMSSLQGLFGQMNPASRDAAVVEAGLAKLNQGLTELNVFMSDDKYAVGEAVTLADCALVPILNMVGLIGQGLGAGDLVASHLKVAAYWSRIQQAPSAMKVLEEMRAAIATRTA
jgi:glutathione S-transferase